VEVDGLLVIRGRLRYPAAVRRCAARGLRSDAVYDALHLVTTDAASADVFLTFDVDDFLRLSEPGGPSIVVPPDPPGLPPAAGRER